MDVPETPEYVLVPEYPWLCGMKPAEEMPSDVQEVVVCVLREMVDYDSLSPSKAKELETTMWFKLYETGLYTYLPDVRAVVTSCRGAINDLVKCP